MTLLICFWVDWNGPPGLEKIEKNAPYISRGFLSLVTWWGILSDWPRCMGPLTWQAAHRHMLHAGCVAVCCSVLQCVAVCCSVLQCVAVWCIRECDVLGPAVVTSGSTRQNIATHCHMFFVDFIHMLANIRKTYEWLHVSSTCMSCETRHSHMWGVTPW